MKRNRKKAEEKKITHPKIIHQNGFLRTSTSKLVRLFSYVLYLYTYFCYTSTQAIVNIFRIIFFYFFNKHRANKYEEKK